MAPPHINDAEEFVNIWIPGRDLPCSPGEHQGDKDFYKQWIERASAPTSIPSITGADALSRLYPNHSLVMTQDYGINLLGFPAAQLTPLEKTPLITNLFFIPLSRSVGIPGILVDNVEFGAFKLVWQQYEYVVYTVQYPQGFGVYTQYFVLHEGPQEVSRLLLSASGAWSDELHDEIWIFNQGFWQKDHGLWLEVQKADWKDVILKDEFKKALQKDVYGFFASESIYKELAIPWKRGLLMYGPPGNGKTISLKTIMKTCGEKGFAPLYVKSFQSWGGEEMSMAAVFNKARQLAPCVIILEDLDSLINDQNRSFFLNQLDGLDGNDGLLIIGTTNHFDRLDPGLSARPSRFDRKYKFDDPDVFERKLYAQYWQKKLASNKEIDLSDALVDEVAKMTEGFSFAYLKEAFVSSLVTYAGLEGDKPPFAGVLKGQIESLRKGLEKSFSPYVIFPPHKPQFQPSNFVDQTQHPPQSTQGNRRDIRTLLDALSDAAPPVDPRARIYQTPSPCAVPQVQHKDIRALLDALSDSLASLDIPAVRLYDSTPHSAPSRLSQAAHDAERDIRAITQRINTQIERRYHHQHSTSAVETQRNYAAVPAPGNLMPSTQLNGPPTTDVSPFHGTHHVGPNPA
ncbi:unnamed protein product [Cyclocybe aegerita]|uniref:AAA+ ATPase domain-containing protein n=1 Tax=Cyclocybe aegerita TaxID=1973307 RepID=A0A8S0W7D2_CYCAE|nr:unnamed protein product [Cyclocybe aegerita]